MGTSAPVATRGVLYLGLLAAFLTAVFKSMDNITVHHFITDQNRIVAAFAYLILGSWTVTATGFILTPFFGHKVDQQFTQLIVRDAQLHRFAFVAGLLAAVSTFFTLLAYQTGDPSALVALSGATLVYVGIYDVLHHKSQLSKAIIVPVLIAAIGSGMAAFTGSLATTLESIVLMLVLSNSFGAASEIVEQRGVQRTGSVSNCALSLMLWRFLWMAIVSTIIAIAVTTVSGTLDQLVSALGRAFYALPFIILTMLIVFFAIGIKMVMKRSGLLSATLLTISTQVLFAYPITLLGESIRPGLFGGIPSSYLVWTVRLLGAGLLIWAMLRIKKIDVAVRKT